MAHQQPTPDPCTATHPDTGNPCVEVGSHDTHRAMGVQRMQIFGDHLQSSPTPPSPRPVEDHPLPGDGPAASETPQDAREVERRERWALTFTGGAEGWGHLHRYDQCTVDALIVEADHEHAALVAERDRARDLAARLEEKLAQAVGERDRLRAVARQCVLDMETGYLQSWHGLRALLATPTPDAQDEVRRG